jgi:hypothetical protein
MKEVALLVRKVAVEFLTIYVYDNVLHWALNNPASDCKIKMLFKAYLNASNYPDECD